MKNFLLTLFCCFCLNELSAQTLEVAGMNAADMDLSASKYQRKDGNDQPCALIKVQTPLQDMVFEGNVVGEVEQKTGEYWVYLTNKSRQLQLKHPKTAPLMVRFADYGIKSVISKNTYVLTVRGKDIPEDIVFENEDPDDPVRTLQVGSTIFKMIYVRGREYNMGGTKSQGIDIEKDTYPGHAVDVSSFWIGETEVTQELWKEVMGKNPAKNRKGAMLPVENVSWTDCQAFLDALNARTGEHFRLPTEAEWELAARGGMYTRNTKYSGDRGLDNIAWFEDNSGKKTHPVKSMEPNELGLYDMSGNVSEWCLDRYSATYYESSPMKNPKGPKNGDSFVHRGGNYLSKEIECRAATRRQELGTNKANTIGLRLAIDHTQPKQ